jgi:hypothetical protein
MVRRKKIGEILLRRQFFQTGGLHATAFSF